MTKNSLRKIQDFAYWFLKEESGQSTTEYILILSVVVIIAVRFKTVFQGTLTNILSNVTNKLNQATSDQ